MDIPEELTRAGGLARLDAVAPRTGRDYASQRNTDRGPGKAPTTTALSPWLRRRLLLEPEVIGRALSLHGPERAQKFVEEVFWRSYFKGHLETHPAAWTGFLAEAEAERARMAANAGLARTVEAAEGGRTGIDCFDAWAGELVADGWLHNHTRMWFASIWIFTLRLPWVLGADFFMRHLRDGDPASNTLSWRWVAGLHTRGKHYVARAENIRRYTEGRFTAAGLDEAPEPLTEERPPAAAKLAPTGDPPPSGEVALLLHLDDLSPETLPLGPARVVRVGGILAHARGASPMVRQADETAMTDALDRAARRFGCEASLLASPVDLGDWAGEKIPIVTAYAPVGPSADALPEGCIRLRRPWDDWSWPHATRGYFQMRKAIPEILGALPPD